jgi:3-methyladenine DNA glycosylase AlkD
MAAIPVKLKNMNAIIDEIRKDLIKNSDEKTRISGERYFKEPVKLHGLKSAVTINIAKEHYAKIRRKPKSEIFELCEELWQSGYMEEAFIACNWSYYTRKEYLPDDINIFERWVRCHVSNWATCDTLCNHTVGTFIEMFPEKISYLKKWATLPGRWMKRASAVTLIIPARKGLFLTDIFEIADILLPDKDDLVQKGYGWMLKAASQAYQKEVFDYVIMNKAVMPRTSLRYAIEKMPKELKIKAMEK